MSNTYTWSVQSLDCLPLLEGQTNVVFNVHYRISGTDGTHTATVNATQPLTYNANESFIPFDSLTQDKVIEWVKSALGSDGITSVQTDLDNKISYLANPPIVTPPLPWSN